MALLKVICWALIFIIRIRFPPGKSLATILNNRYNNGALEAFRKFQRLELKLGKAKLDLEFLSTCKKRSVIPRFLWFKVANRRLRTSSAYRQCQSKLLQDEIDAKHARIRRNVTNKTILKSYCYCFDGFTKSYMLGSHFYYKNPFSAWQIPGYDIK